MTKSVIDEARGSKKSRGPRETKAEHKERNMTRKQLRKKHPIKENTMTNFSDLAQDKNATEFQAQLETVIGTKVNDAIVAKKSEVAGRLFTTEAAKVGARGARPRGFDSAQHVAMDTMHHDEFFKQRGAQKYETVTTGKGVHKQSKTHGYNDKGEHVGTWDHKNAMGSYKPAA